MEFLAATRTTNASNDASPQPIFSELGFSCSSSTSDDGCKAGIPDGRGATCYSSCRGRMGAKFKCQWTWRRSNIWRRVSIWRKYWLCRSYEHEYGNVWHGWRYGRIWRLRGYGNAKSRVARSFDASSSWPSFRIRRLQWCTE